MPFSMFDSSQRAVLGLYQDVFARLGGIVIFVWVVV